MQASREGAPLYGRERELALLHAALDDACAGRGRVLLLAGEPGIGKTRLAEALATAAAERELRPLWGRCYEAHGAPAYWPWVQILRTLLRGRAAESLQALIGPGAADVADLLPELRQALPDLPFPPPLPPDAARFRLFDSIAALFGALAAESPLVVLLDDLHWADVPSLLLLQFLARGVAELPLLLLCAYRDTELDRRHPLSETLTGLRRERGTEVLLLRGIAERDSGRLVQAIAGPEAPVSNRLAQTLHAETEGNPLFLGEIARHLAATDGWRDAEAGRLALPDGVRDAIGRRLTRLSDGCNRVLTVAAVAGREFNLPLLARSGR